MVGGSIGNTQVQEMGVQPLPPPQWAEMAINVR